MSWCSAGICHRASVSGSVHHSCDNRTAAAFAGVVEITHCSTRSVLGPAWRRLKARSTLPTLATARASSHDGTHEEGSIPLISQKVEARRLVFLSASSLPAWEVPIENYQLPFRRKAEGKSDARRIGGAEWRVYKYLDSILYAESFCSHRWSTSI